MKSRRLTCMGAIAFTPMKLTMLLLIAVVTLSAVLLSSNPLAAQGNPAANPTGVYHTYKACWKVAHPGPLDPPGTAIKCYSSPATFEMGDGSLASTPNSNPDEVFSGLPCPLTSTQQFLWVDQLAGYWNAARFYNASGQSDRGLPARSLCGQDLQLYDRQIDPRLDGLRHHVSGRARTRWDPEQSAVGLLRE